MDYLSDIAGQVPDRAGIGLRSQHLKQVAAERPPLAFLEIHAENYLNAGPPRDVIETLRADYALSVHGVGLSLGSAEGLDARHLARVARLVSDLQPALVSEHLAWSVQGGVYLNDLLPLPYTEEALDIVVANVLRFQDALKRPVLVENPSTYLRFAASVIPEAEFLAALAARSSCGLLCDVNNIYVTAHNGKLDAQAYLASLPEAAVGEFHLAGHARNEADGVVVLIDDHGSRVIDPVWRLYEQAVARFGRRPTLLEWDTDVPALAVLLDEARLADVAADRAMEARRANAA